MKRLTRFVRLPFRFKLLLTEAFLRLLAVSLLLRVMPRSHVSRYWATGTRQPVQPSNPVLTNDICRAIVTAAHYVPGATCLVQCITGRAMLRRAGCAAEVKIGVLKDSSDLQAHAWLESEGSVLIGGPVAQYTRLAPTSQLGKLEAKRAHHPLQDQPPACCLDFRLAPPVACSGCHVPPPPPRVTTAKSP
jgi:hypothetical protein